MIQKTLCEIFEKALGTEKVGIEDNFFDLGGSSLTASKVAVMCLSRNISIVYADVFQTSYRSRTGRNAWK